MPTINRFLQRFCAFGAGLSLALVFAIIFVNSLRRYTIGESLEWGEELPIYLSIYGVMFGLGLAYLQDRHIRFTLLTDFLSKKAKTRLFAAVDLATLAVGLSLAWSGGVFAARRSQMEASGLIGTAGGLADSFGAEWLVWFGRMGTYHAAIAFGGGLLALAALVRLSMRLREA
ncbi:TRAP transporter small permease [Limibacillus halophilus]